MDMIIDNGPWETIFVGQVYGHDIEIISNPESFYLVFIYDKILGKKAGAVVEGYKAFLAKGPLEALIQTIPRPCVGIEKNLGEKTSKLFFLSFEPFYLDFKQEDYVRTVDNTIKKIDEMSLTIVDMARASSVDLKELSMMPKSEYAPVLGDPFSLFALTLGKKESGLSRLNLGQKSEPLEEVAPIIQLGLSKTREIIKEPSKNLYRTQINGDLAAVKYASYIIAENMLLENIPVVIFDDSSYFGQLGIVSANSQILREDLIEFEPMGFPVKQLSVKETINISLKDVDLIFLLELLGLKDREFEKNLSLFAFSIQASTPRELIARVLETKELTDYEKLRAERFLMIIDKTLPRLFGTQVPTEELTKTIPGKLGRAVVIDTKGLSQEEKAIFIQTIFRQITRSVSETKQISCVIFVPQADELITQNTDRIATAILRVENRGVGVVLGTEKELPESISQTITTRMSIVSGKDAAISIKGKRNYRVVLRSNLSGGTKLR